MREAATLSDEEVSDLRTVIDQFGGVKPARAALDGVSREAIERALARLPQRVGTIHLIRARVAAYRALATQTNERRSPDQEKRLPKEHEHAERSAR